MARLTGATNTQKTLMLSIYEGWLLRAVDKYGWCLFQPGRERPFARVKDCTVDELTLQGLLTPGSTPHGLGFRPAKDLTPLGRKYAEQLQREKWATAFEWSPRRAREANDETVGYRKAA